MIHDFKNELSIDQIFLRNLGYDFYDFEIKFYDNLRKEYRWMIFLQFDNLIWLLFIFIIVIAFISIKLRNRRVIRKWDIEDSDII